MPTVHAHILSQILRKLELRGGLDEADRSAFLALPLHRRMVEPNVYMIRDGDRPQCASVILEGFAFRQKVTETGARQIVSVHIAGDFIDLESALLNIADHSVQALTRCDMAFIPRQAIRDLVLSHPRLGLAMWVDTLIDGSVFREWIANVGRRDGVSRIAHLICELGRRLEIAGLAKADGFTLPLTQEQLGDATGMTTVHVNRVLKSLAQRGLIRRVRRNLTIPDWEGLRSTAGFSDAYLHFDQVARGVRPDRSL